MIITWDEPKRLANLDKHGMDFADLSASFFLGAVIRPAKLGRFQALGFLADGTVSVIYATLGSGGISVISMCPANAKERMLL